MGRRRRDDPRPADRAPAPAAGFRLGDEELEAAAGGAVVVPAGVAHAYWNAGTGRARYLLVMGPQTFRLIEAIHEMDPFDPARLPELFREHDSELLM